jgi:AcrR family transcriptional regulator
MRSQAKADRRAALLTAAASLFAERGFNGVSVEELGTASGVTGPAVYRHFSGKQAVLAALLVGVSRTLLEGGQAVVDTAPDAASALEGLVAFHVRFALSNRDVIRVQDRDLDSLETPDRHTVRTLQRRYVELWVGVLERLGGGLGLDSLGGPGSEDAALLRIRAQAVFGLINSTPHSVRGGVDEDSVRAVLERIALAALTA